VTGAGALAAVATVAVLVGAALVVLLLPPVTHAGLAYADSAAWLGVPPDVAAAWSDTTVATLLAGSAPIGPVLADGTPLFGAAEAAHLRDVRTIAWLVLAFGALGSVALTVLLARPATRLPAARAVRRTASIVAVVTLALGVFAALAFQTAFTLFHQLLFPGGNWAFDPAVARLVRLYPTAFWQAMAAGLGILLIAGALVARAGAGRILRGAAA